VAGVQCETSTFGDKQCRLLNDGLANVSAKTAVAIFRVLCNVRPHILTNMEVLAFWDIAPYSLADAHRRFRGPNGLHHQGDEYRHECGQPRWNDIDTAELKNSERNLSQCHFVHNKSHMD
jgi:hypothetical protein